MTGLKHARSYKYNKPEYDDPPETRVRACLMCGKEFPAVSRFIRVCRQCKATEAWQSGAHLSGVGLP